MALPEVETPIRSSNLLSFKVEGKLTARDLVRFNQRLDEMLEQHDNVVVYLDMTEYSGFELLLIKEKLDHLKTYWTKIDKIAYILDRNWQESVIGLVDLITPMHIRGFSKDQQEEAVTWLTTPPID